MLAAALTVLPGAVRAAEARPYVGLEAGFRSGEFGTGTRSHLYSAFLNAGVVGEDWDAGATAAFHVLDTEGTGTEAGLGDLVLRAGHVLLPTTDSGLSLYGTGAVKLATGDEDAGLSTGESDLGGFLSLRQRFGGLQATLYGGYTAVGDPPRTDYNDTVTYGGQLFVPLRRAWVYGGAEGRTALTDDTDDPLEVFAGGFAPAGRDLILTGEAFAGLTDGSPDLGVRVGFIRWF
jgi:hypothetical protein